MSAAARRLADAIRTGAADASAARGQHVATITDLSPLRLDVAGLDLELDAEDVTLGSLTDSLELAVGDNLIVVEVDEGEWVAVEALGPAVPNLAAHEADTTNVHGIADTSQLLLANDARGWEPGDIKTTARAAASAGWLMCDGAVVSRTTYAALFAAIGTAYNTGGEAGTDFRLPNLKGKVPVGRDAAQAEFDTLGESGGAKTHTLSTPEIPAHTHGHNMGGGVYFEVGAGGPRDMPTSAGGRSSFANLSISNAGGGGAHNNLQPYQVVNYLIKA